jgi:CheY-like chemotaxis protein/HPt (histidine-containing phosphotransfer) domain-containing protein
MKTIAVIEDNPDNRLLVRIILESQYQVVEFETGPAALEGLPGAKADVVLLDVSLPEMDGTEVLRRMRADPVLGRLPVIALTAHAMAGDRERFLQAGFDDYVSKPILDETVLLNAIQRNLSNLPAAKPLPAQDDSTPLSRPAIENLCRLGGDKFAVQMFDLFLSYGGTKMAEAREAFRTSNLAALANATHALKSSAGNIGAVHVQKWAAQTEQRARANDTEQARAGLEELERAFAAATVALEQERVRLGKAAQ